MEIDRATEWTYIYFRTQGRERGEKRESGGFLVKKDEVNAV